MRTLILPAIAFLLLALSSACGSSDRTSSGEFTFTNHFPHDPSAYTQGLVWDGATLYESTGLYGHSELREVDLVSGAVRRRFRLPDDRFGEGLAALNGRLYQLTWQSGVAYVYDKRNLSLIDSLKYPGEGWGLATDGRSLIMSDGSDSLRIVSPSDFHLGRSVHVRYQGSPLRNLNELEYRNGEILANVYQTDRVARIDLTTGQVKQLLDFSDLYPDRSPRAEVMNGIAVGANGEILLTGKHWPTMFQVQLRPTYVAH